ncbi:hypothetical protein A3G67_02335 [Candidatus Roizmanbacteria bacterium RIFCSPLOWO2_12_FULL_40_12]|uniref:Uncharacterized protein n=1 Tax=Candidatus Roizmanbacteria bacterium RIFCSPLOWO2_01_FULL_40_42 TaxID=1802066 RepID=A0A1F7J511_9BACT|nr:MAG: hypothetical protein A2779_01595 [Candidatus Roizmanbacteria bacterium RIFCSPHIGHO2_01_FULL_40_98]OGK29053.1 MAG: hypothetical protein A3C31_02235 [Candidatus Roizmanbacteria bacterium RIFCSPHIGHO2_02_FULL_40_53]OGK29961.1 MAG: hypothetical protein A2W49_00030 [Candidatus Roizmanbacteria bacterium RIFCSPHIGHO2_12_41_18]OGK36308.1 MAG: hypothetical protein A3E69_03680 [Candidatus Roizmanbacteria bacterium RIFCSPHIGHO2_12_FULL_40_130]OGK50680.1 MAG: hypothetical protein A3B50_00690 [Candi
MPKKTKHEKNLARERKRLRLLQNLQQPETVAVREQINVEKAPAIEPLASRDTKPNSEEKVLLQHFKRDFKKSLVLIVSIIALEIAVYFGTINNYFKF